MKAEYRRIDAFELWCWRRLLRVPWTARRSNPSILKEISPGISLEGMLLKLKLQYFGPLMWRVDSLEKTLILEGLGAGGEGDNRGWDGWMASPTPWMWVWVNSGSWWWTGRPGMLRFMGVTKSRTRLSDWTELSDYHFLGELRCLCCSREPKEKQKEKRQTESRGRANRNVQVCRMWQEQRPVRKQETSQETALVSLMW